MYGRHRSAAPPPPANDPAKHGFADRINGRLERQKVFRRDRVVGIRYRYTIILLRVCAPEQHLFKTPI